MKLVLGDNFRTLTFPRGNQPATGPKRKRPNLEELFKRRDTNKNGFVTLKEYIGNPANRNVPVLTKRFKQLDTNNDGRLSLEEMKKK